jgi:hypothetical protein
MHGARNPRGLEVEVEDMVRAIEANDIRPVVDGRVFGLGEVREAYRYM